MIEQCDLRELEARCALFRRAKQALDGGATDDELRALQESPSPATNGPDLIAEPGEPFAARPRRRRWS
ncbi:hypothetical protein [Nonomuraea sp. NPDC048916]|uniref:hypothetical protein n=1 Tax=Nonomuraea sp. NPDC048916 TaxID=3154232 RepID=UPI00340084E5